MVLGMNSNKDDNMLGGLLPTFFLFALFYILLFNLIGVRLLKKR